MQHQTVKEEIGKRSKGKKARMEKEESLDPEKANAKERCVNFYFA